MLTVENVSVAYGDREVVKGVSFALENGQWLMLCGPNGAGKSTLVKAIAQSVRWSGRIVLEGRNIRTIRPKELGRMVGVLSQNHQLGYAQPLPHTEGIFANGLFHKRVEPHAAD